MNAAEPRIESSSWVENLFDLADGTEPEKERDRARLLSRPRVWLGTLEHVLQTELQVARTLGRIDDAQVRAAEYVF